MQGGVIHMVRTADLQDSQGAIRTFGFEPQVVT